MMYVILFFILLLFFGLHTAVAPRVTALRLIVFILCYVYPGSPTLSCIPSVLLF